MNDQPEFSRKQIIDTIRNATGRLLSNTDEYRLSNGKADRGLLSKFFKQRNGLGCTGAERQDVCSWFDELSDREKTDYLEEALSIF